MRTMWAVALAMLAGLAWADEPAKPKAEKPQHERVLKPESAKEVVALQKRLFEQIAAVEFREAAKTAEAIAVLCEKELGPDHWRTATARSDADAMQRAIKANDAEQKAYASSFAEANQATGLEVNGDPRRAEPLRERVLVAVKAVLGEDHASTATAYGNLSLSQKSLGKYTQAEAGFTKVLATYRKILGENHPLTATAYGNLAFNQNAQGKYKEAEPGFLKALAIQREVLGEDTAETASAYNNLAANLEAQGKLAEADEGHMKALAIRRRVFGEKHPATAGSYNNLASNQHAQGKFTKAEANYTEALAIYRKTLGERHPLTASVHLNLASNQEAQGKYAEATAGFTKALGIIHRTYGEDHPDTAGTLSKLADNHEVQGRYSEAAETHTRALSIFRKVFGENHLSTAEAYRSLARNQNRQGKYMEAEKSYAAALAIRREVAGENDITTAGAYHNLALNWIVQGRYSDAEAALTKALTISRILFGEEHLTVARGYNGLAASQYEQCRYSEAEANYTKALVVMRKVAGEEHRETAMILGNLATNQTAQGKHADAVVRSSQALTILRKASGEEHPDVAKAYSNLALTQIRLGKHVEAQANFEKALAVWRKIHGDNHPHIATAWSGLAGSQDEQGKYTQAEEGFTKALKIRREYHGDDHPDTAMNLRNLAANQYAQGKYTQAEANLTASATIFEAVRSRFATSGLDRALKNADASPLSELAAVLVRNGKPAEAWARFEQSLGRGTLDDLSARLRHDPADLALQSTLVNRLDAIERRIDALVSAEDPPADRDARVKNLLTQQREASDALADFTRKLERKVGPVAGQVFAIDNIQAAIPPATALVGWVDLRAVGPKAADPDGDHLAFVLRRDREPIVVRLAGTGDNGTWTDNDIAISNQLRAALRSPDGQWKPLADQVRKQRLDPLAKHLADVKHLVVLPCPLVDGIPVETFVSGYTVSYAPSGTLYAHLRKQARPMSENLLAVADPRFDIAEEKMPPLPTHGLLVTAVVPGSNAADAEIKPDDVLLQYGETKLEKREDFKLLPESNDPNATVPVLIWRNGKLFEKPRFVRPGKLGVALANEPARIVLASRHQPDAALTKRGDALKPLPGTRVEAEGLARLFADDKVTLLSDSKASEEVLLDLARSGKLNQYRYLHFATHGSVDPRFRLSSCVHLSTNNLPNPQKQLAEGKPVFDGRLTSAEVLREWHLNADLVTLSACETGLGQYAAGEGFVGFAQTMLLAGSRSVVLSLWKVDDTATALLMERFYANLLGRRPELKGTPMSKADALHEAKAWLRTLSRDEALTRSATMTKGVVRGERGAGEPRRPVVGVLTEVPKVASEKETPYAHPFYWAAFVLVGDDR